MLGIKVMLYMLTGPDEDTRQAYGDAVGKVISQAVLEYDNKLILRFTDGTGIYAFDDGQSCCERRYMTTDDDLSAFVGATFVGMEVRDVGNAEEDEDSYDVHEIQFLLVHTSMGTFTMESHNEHNGYYGGFGLVIRNLDD